MTLIIDRIESNYAVVELPDQTMADIPLAILPEGAGAGSVLEITLNETGKKEKEEAIRKKMDRLFHD